MDQIFAFGHFCLRSKIRYENAENDKWRWLISKCQSPSFPAEACGRRLETSHPSGSSDTPERNTVSGDGDNSGHDQHNKRQ